MDTVNKNPLLVGLINVLIPGSSHLIINKDWGKFLRTFLIGVMVLGAAIWTGNLVQQTRGYPLPQGICMGTLLLAVGVVLFLSGSKVARERNNEMNDATLYNSKRVVFHDSDALKHTKIQKMRDEGLISEQEYDKKNAKVESEKT